jgi:hypothetical protein
MPLVPPVTMPTLFSRILIRSPLQISGSNAAGVMRAGIPVPNALLQRSVRMSPARISIEPEMSVARTMPPRRVRQHWPT